MDFYREKAILDILAEVLELASEHRARFLDHACRGDATLRAEVEACIKLDDHARWNPLFQVKLAEPALAREKVGPYQIIKELGRGGMGRVYLAERSDGVYQQQVAIKILKRGMDTADIVKRFLAERQILANLDHPNIAKLLDGGATEDGLPYFVMEYVAGMPMTRYCSENQLSLPARLELFREVCSALAYAHRNLVVHRDIKPSNVLVSTDGKPKLLDFGIAKLLHPIASDPLTKTAPEYQFMTPEYACPEQVRGELVTTTMDVYGLGLLLFELLSGQRPFQLANLSPHEFTQIICEKTPDKPSSLVAGLLVSQSDPSSNQRNALGCAPAGLKKWQRSLKGDLDNIVLKALRKDPQSRYASAVHLAEDIRRHLVNLPVFAKKRRAYYYLGKIICRNRMVMTLSTILVIVFLGFSLHTLAQRNQLRVERESVIKARDKSQNVAEFLVTLFSIPQLSTPPKKPMTAKELLDQGVEKIRQGPYAEKTRADLMMTLAAIYGGMGLFDQAAILLEQALTKRRDLYGDHHMDVIDGLNEMSSLYLSRGELFDAARVLRQALASREHLATRSPIITKTLNNLAETLRLQGAHQGAASYCREALLRQREFLGTEHPDVAKSLSQLALIQQGQGHLAEATVSIKEAMAIAAKRGGERPALAREIALNQASIYQDNGDFELARRAYLKILSAEKKVLGDTHPKIALISNNLGTLLQDMGQYQASERYFMEALTIIRQTFGEDSVKESNILHNLAGLYHLRRDYDGAEKRLRRAITLEKKGLAETHPKLAGSLAFLGWILAEKGAYPEAEELYQSALGMLAELLGRAHPAYAFNLGNYAMVLKMKGDYAAAEPLLRESLRLHRASYGADHHMVAIALNRLALLLSAMDLLPESESLFLEALAIKKRQYPADHMQIIRTNLGLGKCLMKQGRHEAADIILVQTYQAMNRLHESLRSKELAKMLPSFIHHYQVWGKEALALKYQQVLDQIECQKVLVE